MPWKETSSMEERARFVVEYEAGLYKMTELCARYGVSRKTGYKWLDRFREGSFAGLEDLSRAPHSCPHRTDSDKEGLVIETRRRHPSWGGRKIRKWLMNHGPDVELPARSTMGEILKRHGLVKPRKRRNHHSSGRGRPPVRAEKPNGVWTADFKGEFRTGDRRYCYPLTIADLCSRYLLECRALLSTCQAPAREVFERTFREYGLPELILSDGGTPFGSPGLSRLSRLSVWWIRLGIRHVLIDPGHPEQNGCHERMHRTLKAETTRPPATGQQSQQRRFERFRTEYNHERPHEALLDRTPSDLYRPSPRPYPKRLPPLEYPGHFDVRRVRSCGCIKWHSQSVFLSSVLTGEYVGFEEVDDGVWSCYFGPLLLGRYQERENRLLSATKSQKRRPRK